MVKFHEKLPVDAEGVVTAGGPVDSSKEKIVDICAWVFQRGDDDASPGDSDAAATEMTHHGQHLVAGTGEFKQDEENDVWSLPLAQVGRDPLKAGDDAFAVAVAMIEDKKSGKQRVIWWGHPVTLEAGAA